MKSEYARLCGTAASRAKLAAEIAALAQECGATVMVPEWAGLHPRAESMVLAKGDWRCMFDFDGASHVGAFLGHWYSDNYDSADTLPKHFGLTIRGSENEYHRRKATTCTGTFEQFKESLRAGLMALDSQRITL